MSENKEPKVTECWSIKDKDGRPFPFASGCREEDGFLPAALLWREDYDALRKELETKTAAIESLQDYVAVLVNAKLAEANRELRARLQMQEVQP